MSSKEMSVEKIYQKKSQLEHILLRPDTYIGSVEVLQQEMWIWDFENEKMIKKEISFVPGLYKIFDEILGKFVVFISLSKFNLIHFNFAMN
jgi:DNA topoisomerase-2